MGGHGGLNILPQKRWNVYRFDNREKVRQDEEAAARDDQIKRDQSRRRDAEIRLDRLRVARNLPSSETLAPPSSTTTTATQTLSPPSSDSRHINLFSAAQDFSSLASAAANDCGNARKFKREEKEDAGSKSGKRQRRGERPTAAELAALEDEKYKLGYGLVGKGVKAPWYLSTGSSMKSVEGVEGVGRRGCNEIGGGSGQKKGSGKKTVEELREERLRREKKEKERERAIFASMAKKEKGFSRRGSELKSMSRHN